MVKYKARQILANLNPAIAEIEDAIAELERDIAYVELAHPFPDKDMRDSLKESRNLLVQLRDKLNTRNKSPIDSVGDRDE
ncbi:hypothetical protein [Microseira sp. BLCC-F43]|jgi:Mg2+ and Co2+ transporter CorA|uniref:hypothetical protein n=1 Tax=Microseira sp. BLCC-F43 TaxID=3153602 RepID=UPI0035B93AD9